MTRYHDTIVKEFHEAFGHPVEEHPTTGDTALRILRAKLLLEEVLEFVEAAGLKVSVVEDQLIFHIVADPSLLEMADALGDIRYVTDGANLVFGLPGEKVLRAIHRSNMSKLGEDGKPIYRADGKVLKGPYYQPPTEEIEQILALYASPDHV